MLSLQLTLKLNYSLEEVLLVNIDLELCKLIQAATILTLALLKSNTTLKSLDYLELLLQSMVVQL